ncbi:MAG: lipoyl(octanoyl) transferase LipB [Streptosporangiaceae bacterium]
MTGTLVFSRAGLGADAIDYQQAWDLQRALHERRVRDEIPDACLLLEHPPVYTAGRRTDPLDRPFGDPGAPVLDVDRGGKITWHGPGQLVGYPIVRLGEPVDVVAYVRAIEQALMGVCAGFGVTAERVKGRSGVWVRGADGAPDRKVAAIGIRVARGVTLHGFALNCDCDLSWYDRIVPCGIRDATVTTLSAEAGRPVTVPEVIAPVMRELAAVLQAGETWLDDSLAALAGQAPARAAAGEPAAGHRAAAGRTAVS